MFEFKTLKWSVQAPPSAPGDKCIVSVVSDFETGAS